VRRGEWGPESELRQSGSVACREAPLADGLVFHPLKKTFGFFDKHGPVENVRTLEGGGTGRWSFMNCTRPQIIEGGRIKRMMWAEHVERMRWTKLVPGID
jgi:hypothetical protein